MGHGSWFSHFLHGLYERVQVLMSLMGWPFNEEGKTWTGLAGDVSIVDAEGHGAQAFIHVMLVTVILVAMALYAGSKMKNVKESLVPEDKLTVRTFVELFVDTTFGIMAGVMGDKAARYFLPLIGTCAFLILFGNALGLVPGFLPPTASLNLTLACAIIIFFATHIYGIKEHGLAYFKHFFGPIIAWYALPLMLLFLVVETISHIVRPLSLGIRLMANMFADHAVLGVFIGIQAFILPVPILLLGSLVVVVQVLVFCLLSTVYIAMAIEHGEDH